jgi:hypothetical protein
VMRPRYPRGLMPFPFRGPHPQFNVVTQFSVTSSVASEASPLLSRLYPR